MRPVVGIIGNHDEIFDQYPIVSSGTVNQRAISEVAGAIPLIIAPNTDVISIEEAMSVCDGFLLTGARPNVHPEEYGEEATEAHGAFDRVRDGFTLPLVRACVAAGQPILGVCRGFQELSVAMGATLYPEIRDLPGRDNHRMPTEGTWDDKFAHRHDVTFIKDGVFDRIMGEQVVRTNSLHGQGINEAGPQIHVDGVAPDGTAEAIYVKGACGFALGVQWHPEWNAENDSVSRPLFASFGDAARAWSTRSSGLLAAQ